jgi:hypothetical protein
MSKILGPDGRPYDPERPIDVPCGVQLAGFKHRGSTIYCWILELSNGGRRPRLRFLG